MNRSCYPVGLVGPSQELWSYASFQTDTIVYQTETGEKHEFRGRQPWFPVEFTLNKSV